jgi:FkbM family methyltransferase
VATVWSKVMPGLANGAKGPKPWLIRLVIQGRFKVLSTGSVQKKRARKMSAMERLDAKFEDPASRTLALAQRQKITNLIEPLFDKIIDIVKPGVIAEIGAFEASFAKKMHATYKDSRIFAFEANPRVFERFANEFCAEGISYIHVAVGASTGTATIHIPDQIANSAMPFVNRMASLKVVGLRDSKTTPVEVPIDTLDNLLEAEKLTRRCALWIDVEGAVDQVLDGAAKTLAKTDLLICELESSQVWENQILGKDIRNRLEDLGFSIVSRDCQKWFQYNAIFVNKKTLESNSKILECVEAYSLEALSLWDGFFQRTQM